MLAQIWQQARGDHEKEGYTIDALTGKREGGENDSCMAEQNRCIDQVYEL